MEVNAMKALVYHGPNNKKWEDVPDAAIQDPTDVIVKVDMTTICGTDLHILAGDVAAVTDGRILGHEAVGTVTEVGEAIRGFAVGDRVLVPAVTKCGRCEYCQRGMPSHCQTVGGIGWIFGHLIDGTQAEYVRVPFADTSLYAIPEGSATSRQSSSPTLCRPATKWASSLERCARETLSPLWVLARWDCPRF
jgi:alcohol dehydrogenase